MPTKRKSRKPRKLRVGSPAGVGTDVLVACWQDDPGDPASQPVLTPIQLPVPDQSATPLPFKIADKTPPPSIYQPGTVEFLYYANACALRRTADFWGSIVPAGTDWEIGKTLPVNLDSGVDLNAFYTRGDGGDSPGLHFFHEAIGGRVFFSGESPDVACHEMGHAVLDALRPQLFDAQTIEAAAFHESFGDMSALLSALQVPSFRDVLLGDTGGRLNRSSRLSRLAEQLGAAIRTQEADAVDPDCLRNANNSFFYRDPQTLPPSAPASALSSEPHSFSRVFTGAFLDVLAGMFALQSTQDSDGIVQAAQAAAQILLGGIANAAVVPDFFSQVAGNMVQFGDGAPFNGKYHDVLKSAFVRRGILSLEAAATISKTKSQPKGIAAATKMRAGQTGLLPKAAIAASHFGLNQLTLQVHVASEPRRLALSASSLTLGPAETRSSQSAAESYTEDLFQRGHVDVGKYADPKSGMSRLFSFKTHLVTEEGGQLLLKRITFNCGFGDGGLRRL
ncbi:MAG TPA: hypothetical protein VNW47_09305 [Terriglobales bacterium]|nr:hypothetical protein [Terriglobales bacterium]